MNWIARGLVWCGVAALAWAGGTAAYAGVYQHYQASVFGDVVRAAAFAGARIDDTGVIRPGDVVGRLDIPRIGVSVMVFHGVEASTLVAGAGQVPGTPRPGAHGNVVVVAHRDTHFRRLNGIREGDRVFVVTKRRTYAYVVDSTEIVDGGDTHVLESRGREELTLITCYPFALIGAASDRFLVHALPIEHSSPVQKETSAREAGRYDR